MLWVAGYYGITGSQFLGEMIEIFINFAYSLNIVILIYVKKQNLIYRTVSAYQTYDVHDLTFLGIYGVFLEVCSDFLNQCSF